MSHAVDVTVVVATRNRAALLPACLASLCGQRSDATFEVVVVDNGSHDTTAEVAAGWSRRDPRIRVVQEPVAGLSRAKNAGIAAARGELILFTDDDVVLSERWIATYVDFFAAPGAALVLAGGPVLPIAHDLEPWPGWVSSGAGADLPRLYHGPARRRLGEFEWLWGANMAARRRLFDAVGGFDETVGVSGAQRGTFEDVELVQRVTEHGGECWYLPDPVVHHRIPAPAVRPRDLVGRAFNRGANDVLRDRRGSYYEPARPMPRNPLTAALATPPLLGAWMLGAVVFRTTGHVRACEFVRRCAWATGWCTTVVTERLPGPPGRAVRRVVVAARALALRAMAA